MKRITFLFAFLLTLVGGTRVWAQVTDDFSGYTTTTSGTTLGDNWEIYPGSSRYARFGSSNYDYGHYNGGAGDESYVYGYSTNKTNNSWLVLKKQVSGDVVIKASNGEQYTDATIWVTKFTNDNGVWSPVSGAEESYTIAARASGTTKTYDAGSEPTYIGICIVAVSSGSNAKKVKLLQVTYTEHVETSAIPKPTNFALTSTTCNSASFSWTAGGNETAWQIVYGAAGFNKEDSEAATTVNVETNPYATLTNLSQNTTYDAYLRAKAKQGEETVYSSWTSKVTFTTPAQYPAPTGLTVSGQTTTTATLNWTAGSDETEWEISYSENSDFSSSAKVTATSASKELTGLTANTTYYAKVRADYGSGNYSAWTETISFKTLQVATSAASYTDDFENANNWTFINGSLTNAWAWGTATNNGGEKSLYISNDGGNTNAYTTQSSTAMVYASQLFSFAAGDYVISYDWLCQGETGYSIYDYLRVVLVPASTELSAGNSTPSGFSPTALPTGWIALDGGALAGQNTWQHKSVNINIPSNANYYVVFAWYNDSGGGTNPPAAIDNFSVRINDTPLPTNLAVSDITAHTGTLTWASTDNTWDVCVSTSSTAPAANATPTASLTTNSYTFTGLDAETQYYVWVRSVSKTNSSWKSDWVGTNFTTDIAVVAPTGLTATNVTATGATLTWTAGADETKWDLVYGTVNDPTDGNNTSEEIETTPSKFLTGLTANTNYYVFVRAKKGEEKSSWVNTNFTTTYGVPFTEAFGSSLPTGWTQYSGLVDNVIAGTASLDSGSGWNFGTSNGVLTSNHAYSNVYGSSCYRWLVTPTITLDTNQQLTFDLALTAYSGTAKAAATTGTDDKFTVLVSTDNGGSWTKLAQWDNAGSSRVYNDIATNGEEIGLNLSAYNNQSVNIAFYVESTLSNADNNLHIDNVSIDTAPSCVKPTLLTASNETTTSAQLSWTSDGDRWDIQYRVAGEENWTAANGITANPHTLTGLSSSTTYEVQIRNVCGISEQSDWSNTATFTTVLAIDAEHPFTEDFSKNAKPNGWEINNENKTGGSGWTFSSGEAYSGYYGDTYLILPKIAVTEGMYLNFDQRYTYASDYDKSSVVISTTGTAAANFSNELWEETSPGNNPFISLSLDAYKNQEVYIAFKYEGNNKHGWYVDNVMVGMSATANENTSNTFAAGTYAVTTLTYSKAAEKWGTIALPFATTTEELGNIYNTTVSAYKMKSVESNAITFEPATTLEAGKAYVIYAPGAMEGAKDFYNKNITATVAGSDTKGNVTFSATYKPMSMADKWGVTPAGKLMVGGTNANINGFRGYFTTSDGARLSLIIEDTTTDIKTVLSADDFDNESIYNMNGQKVNKAQKGLYIINGKKVIK